MKNLKTLLSNITFLETLGNVNINIQNIVTDSRAVKDNDVYIALKGTQVDGHQFIDSAIKNGAIVIIAETKPSTSPINITWIIVPDTSKTLPIIASNFYDNAHKQLKIVGVTGTNGKTSIATLLYTLFNSLGNISGLISTIAVELPNTRYESGMTTPDPIQLHKIFYEMVSQKCEYCFMEVSSHAIVQNRIEGIEFLGGIFTNITHDHLDYHHTFANYIKAKKCFFDNLPQTAFALTNIDDKNGKIMIQNTKARKCTYGLFNDATYKCKIIEKDINGLLLDINGQQIWFNQLGDFNAYNLTAVCATAIELGKDSNEVFLKASELKPVKGRFQIINLPNSSFAVIDYAHTPDALKNILHALNQIRPINGHLITIIGCGGNRDKTKRPLMAEVAAELSNMIILTSDNPRDENPLDIIEDMKTGIISVPKRKILIEVNRKEAINKAYHISKQNDVILIAGKGHENYQEIKGIKYPFDDATEIINASKR